MSVTHRPKAGATLTGTEYEASDHHIVALDDADIPATIARDAEVTSAINALSTVYQPLDSDLTAIAALTTTAFGRGLLALADAAALLASAGAAASVHVHSGGDITSGTVADARIDSVIARDTETAAAITNHVAATDPHTAYLTSSTNRIPVEDPTFELSGVARMTLGGASELFFATDSRQFRMSAAYAQSMTVPNGYWRLHYKELQLTAANRLTCTGTSDLVLTDLGVPTGRLTLSGRY